MYCTFKSSHSLFSVALARLLSGAAVLALALVVTVGCGGENAEGDGGPDEAVTWHQHVAPIIIENCGSCHTDGGIGPFVIDDYDSAVSYSSLAIYAIDNDIMPPWGAQDTEECQPTRPFKGDTRLSDEEKQVIHDWIDQGHLEGDPATAAPLPAPPRQDIDNPDFDLPFPQAYTVDGDQDDFQCFVIDPGNTEKLWITEIQLVPDNELVDHHGLLFIDFDGSSEQLATDGRFPCFTMPQLSGYLLSTWLPGSAPSIAPAGTGMPMPAGARIVVQMHYHPTGLGPEIDQSHVQLKTTDVAPQSEVAQVLLGNFGSQSGDGTGLQPGPNDNGDPRFFIPAGATDHTETGIFRMELPFGLPIYNIGTHMHYVGTDMKIELQYQGGGSECLVQTPRWDFNWQRQYDYDVPIADLPVIRGGDELHMRCTYNNSLSNPFVAQALSENGLTDPVDVYLGEETFDEMCLGLFGIVVPPGVIEQVF